ncbi:MAG: MFS transporter [Betaproteobacteria bacterium]|nr:MFS transporter [Betaproteobacteria bacterium]
MIAIFMPAAEATIVATAMPTIVAELGGFSLYSWVFAAYLLMQAITTPIYGRLADLFGRKRVFFAGAGLFLASSVGCGLAWGMVPLVAFRTLQGTGAGALQSIPITIIGDLYSPRDRARMQGWLAGVWGIASVTGPMLGAFIVEYLSWPLVFWINLPIGVASIALLALFLDEQLAPRRHDVDYLGALLLMLGVGAPIIALVQAKSLEAWAVGPLLAVGALALWALIVHERRVAEPIIPFRLWRSRVIAVGSFGGLAIGAVLMGVTAFLPTYVQGVLGLGPMVAGAIIGTQSVSWSIAAVVAGWVMVGTSYRTAGAIGALSLAAGTAMLIALDPARGALWAIFGACVVGIGMGFCNTTFVVSVQASVAWNERGVATSSVLFMRTLGQMAGAALGGTILNIGIQRHAPEAAGAVDRLFAPGLRESLGADGIARISQAVAQSLHEVYVITGILALATLALALWLPAGLSPTRSAQAKDQS